MSARINRSQTYADLIRLFPQVGQKVAAVAAAAAVAALPLMIGPYGLSFATSILIAATGAVGFTVLVGWTGLVSLGYAGFLAIGAYTNAYLSGKLGWSALLSIPAAGLVAGLASLFVGVPSLRLRGLYLAITTLAFSIITNQLIVLAKPLTGGSTGTPVARPVIFGLDLTGDRGLYWLCLVVLILVLLLASNIRRTFVGRAFFAVRDYEVAARVLGIAVVRYKLLSFAISSGVIGIAGALFGMHIRYLNVDSFDILLSIEAVSIVLVGGLGSLLGAVLGSVFMTLLPEITRIAFAILSTSSLGEVFTSNAQEIKGALYGLVIILFLRLAPDGLVGLGTRMALRIRQWPFRT